MCWTH